MSAGTPFVLQWFRAIPDDTRLSPTARNVARALSAYLDADGRNAYPTHERLAYDTGLSVGSVRRALAELRQHGWIQSENRSAPGRAVAYRAVVAEVPPESRTSYTAHPCAPFTDEHRAPMRAVQGRTPRTSDQNTAHPCAPTVHNHPIINTARVASLPGAVPAQRRGEGDETRDPPQPHPTQPARRAQHPRQDAGGTLEADFDEAWALYPRKLERGRALRAYTATRRRGASAEDLLTATRHYAADRAGEPDPDKRERFTKHAATFFGPDEPWRDHLEPPSTPTRPETDEEYWTRMAELNRLDREQLVGAAS